MLALEAGDYPLAEKLNRDAIEINRRVRNRWFGMSNLAYIPVVIQLAQGHYEDAARLARGCTSGQALTGGALMSAGSWAFMMCVFGGGYALAYFVRREWR